MACTFVLYIVSLFVYNFFCGGHRPPESTGLHELRSSRGVCFEMLEISSHIVCVRAFKFTGRLQCTLLFKKPYRKKSGAVKSGDGGGHGTAPKGEITRCGNKRRRAAMLITGMWTIAPSC